MIRSEGLGFKSSPRYLNGQLRLSVFFVSICKRSLLRSHRGVVVYSIVCKPTTYTTAPRHQWWCACNYKLSAAW